MRARVPADPEMIWAFSSGTSGVDQVKCLGLTRAAVLSSAAAVNRHLGATAADRWLVAIPTYHVGGFAIAARAHLSGAGVDVLPTWGAAEFHAACRQFRTTLCSLVPTQIFDLVAAPGGGRAPRRRPRCGPSWWAGARWIRRSTGRRARRGGRCCRVTV
jgi:acyl-CoA synthetase (AMP-forming)/AMP-acid ligase II